MIKEKDKQKLICLEEVKIYGNNPMKLFHRIIKNILIKIIKFDRENVKLTLNSFIKNSKIIFQVEFNREGISQYW